MKLIDNINTRLIDDLKESIHKKSKMAIAASSFSIYAFEALRKELQSVDELRFIFTSPSFLQENLKKEIPKFFIPNCLKKRIYVVANLNCVCAISSRSVLLPKNAVNG
ncbi:hypothetical protein MG290_02380 [Flavobacterium sp. CBA20B-1]|uniref:hypothetical protein n=1 Tax=unclassified Flavobacterium TaxID=196869 RepID=UPI0022251C21|nr:MULTISPECIES: hypothetical protein [unclassified Flavobacterium]WCM42541.1 hypothetical protein MG290_02380 [Flavobacterium sp. CBA20B-1]